MTTPASDFDAAKAITDQLKGMEKDRQERILRWVTESLSLDVGLTRAAVLPGPATRATEHTGPNREQRDIQGSHRPVDIKTFVDSKRPKSDVQFATVVAYYYRFEAPPEKRKETIDANALQDAARLAGRRRTKPQVTLHNAKTLGYLDAPTRGQFQINTVGENLVAMTLPGGEEGGRRKSRRNATRGKRKPRKR